MTTPPENYSTELEDPQVTDLVPAVLRFLRILRYRQNVIIATLCIAALVGTGYFALAARYYQSTAKLLIVHQREDQLSTVGDHVASDNTMATHRELVVSPVVLKGAIENLAPEHRVDFQRKPSSKWVATLANNLMAKAVRRTNFIKVQYQSKSPEVAAATVRAIIQSYLQFVENTHRGTATEVVGVLTTERTKLEMSLSGKQHELQKFRQKVGHIAVSSDAGVVEPIVKRAIFLNDNLMEAQQKRLELQASLASIEAALKNGEDVHQYLASVEEVVGRQMMLASLGLSKQDLDLLSQREKQLLDVQAELKRQSRFLGPNHEEILSLQEEAASIASYLQAYRSNVGHRFDAVGNAELGPVVKRMLKQSVAQAVHKEEQILASFTEARSEAARHSGDLVKLQMLEREVARLETQYDMLFEKIAAVDIRQVQAPIQATVVEEPLPNQTPVTPRLQSIVLASLLGGLILGGVIVYVQDVLDDRFSSPEEMAAQLSTPVLAIVRPLEPLDAEGVESIHANINPHSFETEAFRTLRTTISLNASVTERLLISSAEPGDGKTTVSANLAVSFAQAGKKTLIIDADLRKPGLTSMMGMKGQVGVSDILVESGGDVAEHAQKIVRETGVERLDVLPAGLRRPSPSELLSGSSLAELLAWADSRYDQVLVDCPPVLAVSDAQIVGRLVDGAILVIRPDKNHRRLVLRACESFSSTGTNVIGVVANSMSSESSGAYEYNYGDGYGYGYEYGDGQIQEEPDSLMASGPRLAENTATDMSEGSLSTDILPTAESHDRDQGKAVRPAA
jgi:succinoglycan biosynthesis transport protein ExoP